MTDNIYKIYDTVKKAYIYSLTFYGDSVINTSGTVFDHYEQAVSYLKLGLQDAMDHGEYVNPSIFQIHEMKMTVVSTEGVRDHIQEEILSSPGVYWSDSVRVILRRCVKHGFREISPELLEYILTDARYSTIIEETVPNYMYENILDFMDSGIEHATTEVVAQIMLTSPDQMITMYHMVDLINK